MGKWYWGFLVSLVLGSVSSSAVVAIIRLIQVRNSNLRPNSWPRVFFGLEDFPPSEVGNEVGAVPPVVIGIFERALFTCFVRLQVTGYPIAMMAWVTVKMVNLWGSYIASERRERSTDGQDVQRLDFRPFIPSSLGRQHNFNGIFFDRWIDLAWMNLKIISGTQSGAGHAALDLAIEVGIPYDG